MKYYIQRELQSKGLDVFVCIKCRSMFVYLESEYVTCNNCNEVQKGIVSKI